MVPHATNRYQKPYISSKFLNSTVPKANGNLIRVLDDKSIFKEPRTCYSSLESLAPAAFSVASSAICRDSGEDVCQASEATDTIKNTRNVRYFNKKQISYLHVAL
jgi:hypothetical protein